MKSRFIEILAIAVLLLLFAAVLLSEPSDTSPLRKVADIPLPGAAVRFDYQSLDTSHGRLYIAHMNANQLVVFDVKERAVVANLDGFSSVHGVWAVPELGRVYASTTGQHTVNVVDMATLKTIARAGPIKYPDGIAYAPQSNRVFVSDEHGDADAVIDANTNSLVTTIPLGGGAGNTVYDSGSGHIFVAVHEKNELVSIDPFTAKIIGHYPVSGVEHPHGISLDVPQRLAFVAGEENHKLAVVDLTSMKVLATYPVGEDPDVLAFDPGVFAIVLFLYIMGIFFHYVSDAQKFFTLRERKGLIEDGLFTRTRNPNYLGEILIYLSYAIMSMHWIPFVVLGAWVFGFFVRNMLRKDKSLARHPEFAEYKAQTGLLFPKVFQIAKVSASQT